MQNIPCPVCKTPISIDVHLLLQGGQFVCPNCSVAIKLASDSKELVERAVGKLDALKKISESKSEF